MKKYCLDCLSPLKTMFKRVSYMKEKLVFRIWDNGSIQQKSDRLQLAYNGSFWVSKNKKLKKLCSKKF